MSEVRSGWPVVPLATVGKWCSGGTPSRKNPAHFGGKIPWIKSGDLPDGDIVSVEESITEEGLAHSSAKLLPAGTLSVAMYGATIGRLGVTTFPAATNQACANIIPDPAIIDTRYLFRYLQSQRKELVEFGQGGAQPNISQEILKRYPIPVPPIDEQRRIVAKLETLLARVNAARERLDKIPTLLKRFRQAVLTAACTGELSADWREKIPLVEHVGGLLQAIDGRIQLIERNQPVPAVKEVDSARDIPELWRRCKLSEIFHVRTGATPLKAKSEYYHNGTIPWVKTGEVQNCDIWTAEERITPKAVAETNAKIFPKSTLLIAMYGEGKTRGQIGRLRIEAATNQACAALVNPNLADETNEYVFYFALGQYHRLRAEAMGGNQPNLSLGIIKDWEVPLPPLGEQLEIVRRIKSMFDLAEQLDARLGKTTAQVERITQSILAKAFRGELDVHATAEHVTQLARLESIPKKSISLGSASLEDA